MTSGESRVRVARLVAGSPARELAATLLLGAIGAGLVFLASHATWAHVRTIPPRPLPASNVAVSGAQLVPFTSALVLAGLATLGAVLATRGALRRAAGVLLAAIGAALAATAFTVSTTSAISAAAGLGPAAASAGSVMDGRNAAAAAVPNVAGTTPEVFFSAGGWQAMVVVGALAMMAAGALVAWRARRLAVMSSRYDAPGGTIRPAAAASGPGGDVGADHESAADSESIWEALSRGHDPTAGSASTGF